MLRSIGALMVSTNSGLVSDPDARAFIDAAGITDTTQKNAINALVIAAKANGWWTLCNAIYPMVGGTATAHKFNLKDPQDTDAAFRIDFLGGGWTHGSTGATPNGTTSYADTFLVPSTALTMSDTHVSFYSRTNEDIGNNANDIGRASGTGRIILYTKSSASTYAEMYNFDEPINAANSDSLGFYMSSRVSSTDFKIYKNGVSYGSNTNTVTGALPNLSIYLSSAGGSNYSIRECAFATIGAGISGALAATMYTDIQAYQTSLSRNV